MSKYRTGYWNKGYVICSTDEQGMKKLKDKAGIFLVAVYPNYSFSGEEDSYKDSHELLYYMVLRQIEGSSNETEINQYEETQEAIIKLKEYLFGERSFGNNFCKMFPDLNINSVNIIPEYKYFWWVSWLVNGIGSIINVNLNMGLLKKVKKQPKPIQTVASMTLRFLLIDELKKKRLLETTATGIFYMYLEVIQVNKNPDNFLKNIYVYGRATGLLKEGEVLQIRDPDDSALLASILADKITKHY
ncbi:hypothetical protein [Sphingobacterium daejeonense]|uniref:hypothetical protein n=1 Tax=Sphingobacterium daejeonense TaxID=371142 RepID=UPI0010C4998D|nr:hypothetical protein [Sphingobacterium daejeonense]VTQ01686.1 Uncharacterised protein [Sphingobacterium daejeonense]